MIAVELAAYPIVVLVRSGVTVIAVEVVPRVIARKSVTATEVELAPYPILVLARTYKGENTFINKSDTVKYIPKCCTAAKKGKNIYSGAGLPDTVTAEPVPAHIA